MGVANRDVLPPGRRTTGTLRALHVAAGEGSPALTLTQLVSRVGVSRPTVEDALTDLVQRGLVEELLPGQKAQRQVGRPAKTYQFHRSAGFVLGIDIGVHKILALCTDLIGTVIGRHRIDVSADLPRRRRLAAARSVARRAATAARLQAQDALALGVATTGPVDPQGRVIWSQELPDWSGVDLPRSLHGLCPAGPVLAGNDSKVAALAEQRLGVARDAQDVIHVLAGHRISTGIVLGGQVREGRHGTAGEIGVMREAGWFHAVDELRASGGRPTEAFVHDLAVGIAATVLTIDPDVVVIGGGLSRDADELLERLRRHVETFCHRPVRIELSTLGEDSVALGATQLALDHVAGNLLGLN